LVPPQVASVETFLAAAVAEGTADEALVDVFTTAADEATTELPEQVP